MEKITDSKGNIYDSCPYIDKIKELLSEAMKNLEAVRKINSELRAEAKDYKEKYEELRIIKDNIDSEAGVWSRNGFDTIDAIKEFKKQIEDLSDEIKDLKG